MGKDYASIEWNPPTFDGGSKITGYRLYLREDGTDKWVEVSTVGAYTTSYSYKKLRDDKKYHIAVVAENKVGLSKRCETDEPVCPKKPASNYMFIVSLPTLHFLKYV